MKTVLQKFRIVLIVINILCGARVAHADWTLVGPAGFSGAQANWPKIAVDSASGTVYTAYGDLTNNGRLIVTEFDGTQWDTVGTSGISDGYVEDISLTIDKNGAIYVAYIDDNDGDMVYVKTWNGTNWVGLGANGGLVNDYWSTSISLTTDNNAVPYIAFNEHDNVLGNILYVRKFDGTSWVSVGNRLTGGDANYISITMKNNNPWVAYLDGANGLAASVLLYDGSSWSGFTSISPGEANFTSIKTDHSGNVYVAFSDATNGWGASVLVYNGSNWQNAGPSIISNGWATDDRLVLDYSGNMYITYTEYGTGDNTTVMKFDGSSWNTLGTEDIAGNASSYGTLAFDKNNTAYVCYQDVINNSWATVQSYYQSPIASFQADTNACVNDCIPFTNNAANATSWQWTFEGGTPASSSLQNPGTVCYYLPGTYTTTLVASNSNGSDTSTQAINVHILPSIQVTGSQLCDPNKLDWATWTSVNDGTASGKISDDLTISITQSGGGMGTTGGIYAGNLFPTEYNVPVNSTAIMNQNAGIFTFCFSHPVIDPQIALSSIGNAGLNVQVTTSDPYTIIWAGPGMTYQNDTTFAGQEGYTIVRFPGLHSCISFNYHQFESYCNLAFGVKDTNCQGTTIPPICIGSSVPLLASGNSSLNNSFAWSPSATLSADTGATVIATPSVTTTYYAICTANNCSVTDSVTVTVRQTPAPTAIITGISNICTGQSDTLTASGNGTYSWNTGETTSSIIADPNNSFDYRLIVTDANSCIGTTDLNVTASPLTVSITGNTSFCTGTSTTLDAGAGFATYSWSDGETTETISVSTSNTFSVSVANSVGCTAQSATVNTSAPFLPSALIQQPDCNNDSVRLGATSPVYNIPQDNDESDECSNGAYFDVFTFAGIDNEYPGCPANANTQQVYAFFPSMVATVIQDSTYSFTITPDNNTWLQFTYAIWIDFNGNGSFDDPGELIYTTAYDGYDWSMGSYSDNITIPSNVPSGFTRMRVRMSYADDFWPGSSASNDYGETQDYMIQVGSGSSHIYSWTSQPAGFTSNVLNPGTPVVSTDTTYFLTVTDSLSGCSLTSSAKLDSSITTAPGAYGNNIWDVYAYNYSVNTAVTGDPGISNDTYEGSYVDPNFNFDSGNLWNPWGSASDYSGYTGCPVNYNYNAITYKRKGFTTGVYSIDIPYHDASCYLYINDSLVFEDDNCCEGNYGVWSGILDSTTRVNLTWVATGNSSEGALYFNTLSTIPNVGAISGTTAICVNTNSVNYLVDPTNTGADYYVWSVPSGATIVSGDSTNSITVNFSSNATSGNVSVYGVNAYSAGDTSSLAITVDTFSVVTITTSGPTGFCSGSSISLYSTTGASYMWSTGDTTSSINVSTTNSYSVTVTDANGCSVTSNAIGIVAYPIPSIISTNASICGSGTANLSATTSSGTINWYADSTGISLLTTGNSFTTPTISSTTTYYVNATDVCPSTMTAVTAFVNALPTPFITPSSATTFCQGDSVTLSVNTEQFTSSIVAFSSQYYNPPGSGDHDQEAIQVLGAPDVYPNYGDASQAWTNYGNSNGGEQWLELGYAHPEQIDFIDIYETYNPGAIDTVYVLNPNTSNYDMVYSATAAWAGDSATKMHITFPQTAYQVSQIRIAINTGAFPGWKEIDAASIGNDSYNVSWSTGETTSTITASASGNYAVSIDNGNGCSATSDSTTVTVNSLPTVMANTTSASVCSGSNVTLTGGGATSYAWDNSVTDGAAFAPSANQIYTVTGTDGNSCSATATVSITVNSLPVVIANTTLSSVCSGSNVTLTGSGASSYTWDNSVADGIAFAPSGTTLYTVTGTDSNSCSATDTVTVTVNLLPSVTANTTSASICSGSNVTLTGGGATSYIWDNSVTDGVAFAPSANQIYTVTGTDGNSCSATATVSITVNTLPTVTANTTSASVCSGSNVTLTGSGATSYAWDNSVANGVAFAPSSNNIYTVTGTDGNSCSATATVSITVNSLPTVSANTTASSVCSGSNVTLSGSGASSYTWDNSVADGVAFAPSGTTLYTVTGTDSNSCSATDTITITVNSLPTVTANSTSSSVCSGSNVTLTGGGASTYAWDNSVTDGVAFTPSANQIYTVTGTDGNSCSATATVSVTVTSIPSVASTVSSSVCGHGQVVLSGTPSSGYLAWYDDSIGSNLLENGDSLFTQDISTTTTYYAEAIDNGCISTKIAVLAIVNATPLASVAASGATAFCDGGNVTLSSVSDQYALSLIGMQYTVLPINSPETNYTYELRFKTSNPNASLSSVRQGAWGNNSDRYIRFSSGNIEHYLWSNEWISSTGTNYADNQWHHVAVVVESGVGQRMYVDGLLVASGSKDASDLTTGDVIQLGATQDGPGNAFVDDVRLWDVVKTQSEIQAIMNTDISGTPAHLLGNWKFNEGTGTTTINSVDSVAGTLVSGASWIDDNTNTYMWSTSETTQDITVSSTASYSVTVTSTAGCSATSVPTDVTVNAIPSVTGTTPASRCDSGTVDLSATASAGTLNWYADSTASLSLGTGASFTTPVISSTTTYYVNTIDNGCSSTITPVTATVNITPTVSSTTPAARCDSGTVMLGATCSTGVPAWFADSTGNSFIITGSPFTTPVISSSTTYYVSASGNGCTSARTAVTATINAAPSVTLTSLPTVGACNSSFGLSEGSPAGGVYTGTGVSGTSFDPSIGAGTYPVTYTYTDTNGCFSSASNNVVVEAVPTVTLSSFSNVGACNASFTLTGGSPSGGIYSGTGVTGTLFNPSVGAGTYAITYTYFDHNGCISSDSANITVDAAPSVTMSSLSNVGSCNASFALTGGSPSGGIYSGTGVNNNNFSPSVGAGTYTVTYTYTDGHNCASADSTGITVVAAPNVTFSTPSNPGICQTSVPLSGGSPSGGVYSGTAVTNGVFNPSAAGTGTYTLTYTVQDTYSCTGTATSTISVTALPFITSTTPASRCDVGTVTLAATAGNGTINWYANATGGSSLSTGATFTTPSLSSTTTYYAEATHNNCPSTRAAVVATVNYPTSSSANVSLCAGQELTVGSYTFNTTGTHVATLTGANGCDSIVTINMTVNNPVTYSQTIRVCAGDHITVGSSTYSTPGIYTDVLTGVNGCDSTVTTNFNLNPLPTVTFPPLSNIGVCSTSLTLTGGLPSGGVYSGTAVLNGTFNASVAGTGTQTITYTYEDINSCSNSATSTVTVTPLPTITSTTPASICGAGPVTIAANASAGALNWYANATGGSSLATGSSFTTPSLSASTTYYAEATINSCASTRAAVTATVAYPSTSSMNANICSGQQLTVGSNTFSTTGTHTATLRTMNGCDSTVTIHLTVNGPITGSQIVKLCAGQHLIVGSHIYNASGTYTDVLTAASGCDSTVTTHLTVNSTITGSQTVALCAGQQLTVGSHTYSSSGTFTDVLTATGGCDSTVTTHLTVNPAITGSQTVSLCAGQQITVGSHTYSSSGTFTDVLTATGGCDSTVTTYLTVNPAITGSQTLSVCAGQQVTVGSHTYSSSGTFTDILTASGGCDSTVTTHLTVSNAITGSQTLTLCSGGSITVGAHTYTSTGTYTDVFTASGGCDSTVTTDLTVNPSVNVSTTVNGSDITANATSATYQWISCDNANAIISGQTGSDYIATANGDYAVIVTVSGCTDTSSCVNIIATGIENNTAAYHITVYPNPNSGVFNIRATGKVVYSIISELGQAIRNGVLNNDNNYTMDVKDLSSGIYYVIGYDDHTSTKQKIVVVK